MQDNQLHGNLSVEEAMSVAANLKMEASAGANHKEQVVSPSSIFF